MTALVVRHAEVAGQVTSVVIDDGTVVSIDQSPEIPHGAEQIDARRGALLPGLHDHHLHLRATAAAQRSVHVGPPGVTTHDGLQSTLRAACRGVAPGEWVRAVGYHESVAGLLDRSTIDLIEATVPIRIQHRSGGLWMLNSAGVREAKLEWQDHPGIERHGDGRLTGRLWRADELLRGAGTISSDALHALSALAASYGVTGFTDASPDQSDEDLLGMVRARESGAIGQRLYLMAPLGTTVVSGPSVVVGPVKIILDDATLPSLDDLSSLVAAAHHDGRAVAIHCVTAVQSVLALAALETAGALEGDRLEHASVLPPELDDQIKAHSLTLVTQPHFIAERGDEYLSTLAVEELDQLYRCQSLRAAGIPLGFGSDSPFGALDPWEAIVAATSRQARSGRVLGRTEIMAAGDALACYLGPPEDPGHPRGVSVGSRADLCLLDGPLAVALRSPSSGWVRATWVGGDLIYEA
jgi:predicted amidohydrolase YtcJ